MSSRAQRYWLGLMLLAAAPLAAQADADVPSGRVGRLSYLAGGTSLQVSGDTAWSAATINYPLSTGDRIYVDQGGRAELELGGATLRLSDATDVTITNLSDQLVQIGVASGDIRLTVTALDSDDSLEIDTPGGPIVVTAPGVYRLSISPDRGTVAAVDAGALVVGGGDGAVSVNAGKAVQLTGDDTLEVSDVDFPPVSDFDRWGGDRDHGAASAASAQYVDPSTPGYSDLDGAGAWETDATDGPVWYPSAVPVGWAPYRYGRWVWIEPWGWTWVESEPWGYAPFHYGRWIHARRGWGWAPGPVVRHPCYAPALVVFVGVGSGGVQAWFPLGPREAYNPWYHVDDRYRRRVNGPGVDIAVVDVDRAHYANRSRGFTAVSSETFRGGISVARRTVTVSSTQVTTARIIPHPPVLPTIIAMRGRPARQPPPANVVGRRVTTVVRPVPVRRGPVTETHPVTPTLRPEPPSRPVEPARPAQRPVPPPRPKPMVEPLRGRVPPPPADPSLAVRQHAMTVHPGRPLEPQQLNNLRQGKPAGPMRDQEVPKDPRPAAKPAPRPQAPPPAKPQPKPRRP